MAGFRCVPACLAKGVSRFSALYKFSSYGLSNEIYVAIDHFAENSWLDFWQACLEIGRFFSVADLSHYS
jgi:hypothetical protein